jgi:uncharacterized tellurite resistance protein B-like protein
MVSFLKKFLDSGKIDQARYAEASQSDKLQIAICAIFIDMAQADDEFTDIEKNLIIDTLTTRFALAAEDAVRLIDLAKRKMDDSIDIWNFTNIINENLSQDERLNILEIIWRIIFSDGKLSGHEDSLVHKLSFLLELTHEQMIAVKLKVLKGK